MFVFPQETFNFFTVLLKSARTVFQSERVLNIFNMVISGIKTQFYTLCMKSKYGWITNTIIKWPDKCTKSYYILHFKSYIKNLLWPYRLIKL